MVIEMADNRKSDTVEKRAVQIAAVIMQAAGLCRYNNVRKCHWIYVEDSTCVQCIRSWLLSKARAEIKKKKEHEH